MTQKFTEGIIKTLNTEKPEVRYWFIQAMRSLSLLTWLSSQLLIYFVISCIVNPSSNVLNPQSEIAVWIQTYYIFITARLIVLLMLPSQIVFFLTHLLKPEIYFNEAVKNDFLNFISPRKFGRLSYLIFFVSILGLAFIPFAYSVDQSVP